MIHFYFRDKLINDFFYKDVFCVPVELSKQLNIPIELHFIWTDKNIKSPYIEYKHMSIVIHGSYLKMFLYFLKNIKKIKLLWLFHIYKHSILFSFFYKLFNKKWKIYVKWDFNKLSLIHLLKLQKKNKKVISYFLNKIDIISFENRDLYNYFQQNIIFNNHKIILQNSLYPPENIKLNNYKEKENIILVVWRIYFEKLKRYKFLLQSLENITNELQDWEVIFIWNTSWIIDWIEHDFIEENKNIIEDLMNKWVKIIFLWPLTNREVLYNYYNKSKIFCISSPSEWDPLVQYEAMYYSNLMVSTDTGTIKNNYYNKGLFISDINDQDCYTQNLKNALELTKDKDIQNIYKNINVHCVNNFTRTKNVQQLITILKWD